MIKMQLNEIIESRGLRKKYIADYLEVNANTLSNWINHRSFPRLDQAVTLAKLLECSIEDLFELEDA